MHFVARPRLRRALTIAILTVSAAALGACQSSAPKSMVYKKTRSKEYFAESEYGVKASPRVSRAMYGKRGGGRDQLGKPYQVRGKWYYPKEDRNYAKVGQASWYGDAFHGRLTANGEVYDMEHLTAAHPTMPLPSYARVTNLATGSSVLVRVNDRGPYHDGRIIDVSKRAAEMLDYGTAGTARVKVEYVGRAPLDGDDEPYLEASYRPGNKAPDPSVGLPTGVMVAMNGSTPSESVPAAAAPFPGQLTDTASAPVEQPAFAAVQTASFDGIALPDFGPIVPERPDVGAPAMEPGQKIPFAMASLGYAADAKQGSNPFAAMEKAQDSPTWKHMDAAQAPSAIPTDYVAAGTFETASQAKDVAAQLAAFGLVQVDHAKLDGQDWYSVNLYPNGKGSIDFMLEAAWTHGAPDAFAVRD